MRVEQSPARARTARAPSRRTSGRRRSPGTSPFSSQAVKKKRPVDVRHELARAARLEHARGPTNAGIGDVLGAPSRASAACARASANGSSGLRAPAPRAARAARSCSARLSPSNAGAAFAIEQRSTPRRRRATRRARAPSRREYSGAIFTAVCCRLVVAPPISSGIVEAAPLHLAAPRAPSRRATA